MTRRSWVLVWLAACLRADEIDDIKAMVNAAAAALGDSDEKGFLAAFNPAMKGYRELAANARALVRAAEVQASVQIWPDRMIWSLDMTSKDASAGGTKREGAVTYRVEKSGGKVRFASFEPVSLFAPPHGREAWDVVSGIAEEMQLASRYAEGRQEDGLPPLMAHLDSGMPGRVRLEADLRALTSIYVVEPEVQLLANEGSDDRRLLQLDWSMVLTDPNNSGNNVRKQASVNCTVEKKGKVWLVTSLAPLDFFTPPTRNVLL